MTVGNPSAPRVRPDERDRMLPNVAAALAAPVAPRLGSRAPQDSGVRVLFDLTDEELVAVDGPEQGVVTLPYVAQFGSRELETARSTALRSLFARGLLRMSAHLVDDAGRAPAPGQGTVDVDPDLTVVLTARRSPSAVMAVQRVSGGSNGPQLLMRYLHLCGSEVLIEDVSASGIHRYVLAKEGVLPALMQEFLAAAPRAVEPKSSAATEEMDRWPTEWVPSRDGLAFLADVHVVAEIIVRKDDAPASTSRAAYIFPEVAYVGTAPLDAPRTARLRRMAPEHLGRWAVKQFAAAVAGPARPAPGVGESGA